MKTHISLNVTDVAKSIDFYKKMFGAEPFKVRPDYAKFDIANPPLNLTMNQATFTKGGSLSHLGLQVETTEDVLKIGKRWAENGLITLDEMQTNCCFALQDKTWVSDPDGNSWEVFVVLDNNPPETAETKTKSASCCAQQALTIGEVNAATCCVQNPAEISK